MVSKQEALVQLCLRLLPIWSRQLATSCTQSEAAVSEMLGAFSALGPHLTQSARQSTAIANAMRSDWSAALGGAPGLGGLADACEHQLKPLLAMLDDQAAAPLHQVLRWIRESVVEMESAVAPLRMDAQEVGAKIEQMYVGFQYQDRINQVMALLQEDMGRLHKTVESELDDAGPLAVEPWLARLESSYAMAEQHRDHAHSSESKALPGDDSETCFF